MYECNLVEELNKNGMLKTFNVHSTVNVEIFVWGNFCIFRDCAFIAKNYPHTKITPQYSAMEIVLVLRN